MSEETLGQADLEALVRYDTPTICNALELVVPERRALGFTSEPMVAARPSAPPMVGFARTATIRAAAPSDMPQDCMIAQRTAYYEYVASGPQPSITVIQDLDARPGFGAFWGEVNSAIHKGLGCLGCVTNGSFRDIDDLAPGFQILGGEVGPSHAHVHLRDFGTQVTVYGMTVADGDVIHADKHGAVVIPASAVRALPEAVDLVTRREAVILEAARSADFDIEKLKAAMAESRDIH